MLDKTLENIMFFNFSLEIPARARFEATERSKSLLERALKPLFRSKSLLEHASFSFEATERCFELYFVRLEHASFSVDTTERCFELYFVRLHRRRKAPYADLVYIYIYI